MTRTATLVAAVLLLGAALCPGQQPSPLSYAPPDPPPPPAPIFEPLPLPADAPVNGLGFFLGAEVAFLKPTIKANLANQMPLGQFGQTLHVPSVDLDWEVAPAIEVGYRLPGGDAYVFGYRILAAEGNGQFTNLIMDNVQVRTRLNVQFFDFDYALAPYEVAPRYVLTPRIGVRVADVFFDTRSIDVSALRQASNDFFGAGVHGRLDLRRSIDLVPGLSIFGGVDGAVLIGQSRQKFRLESNFGEFVVVDRTKQHEQQTVPVLNLQAGLSYAPPALPGLLLTAGYEYERIFDLADVGPSRGEVYYHGAFVRARFDF
jgi:Legionella pneumophila major outer membrane protein precursor